MCVCRRGDEGLVLTVTDLGSSNGTYVDGTRVPAHQPVTLLDGQNVSFGTSGQVYVVSGLGPRGRQHQDSGSELGGASPVGWSASDAERPRQPTLTADFAFLSRTGSPVAQPAGRVVVACDV